MNRLPRLLALFSVAFLAFLIATTPLAFVLKLVGATNAYLHWEEAKGTVWRGKISGLSFQMQQPIGDVTLEAKPLSWFGDEIGYSFNLEGAAGKSTGDVFLGRRTIRLVDFDAQIQLANFVGLVQSLRRANATLNINNTSLFLKDGECADASGDVSSDALVKLASQYNVPATDLTGNIRCDQKALQVLMTGELAPGDLVTSEAHLLMRGLSGLRVQVETADVALGYGLLQYGFEEDITGFVFQNEMTLLEGF